MIEYLQMEKSDYNVIHKNEPNQQYLLRDIVLGDLVLKLPFNNPNYHPEITESEIEELTTIE